MEHKILVPSVGESITEVRVLNWTKKNGEMVKPGDILLELETDKASVEVVAEHKGALNIVVGDGQSVQIGAVLGAIDDAKEGTVASSSVAPVVAQPKAQANMQAVAAQNDGTKSGPAAQKMALEHGVSLTDVSGSAKGGRVTKADIDHHIKNGKAGAAVTTPAKVVHEPIKLREGDRRVPMTTLRQKIAERLVQAQHTAAILTTFNEVDLGAVMELRKKHKDAFKQKYGVGLGFMSFFTRACAMVLQEIPGVNASIDGTDIIYHDYADIGVAVGTDRGLVVPVLRSAHKLTFAEIEKGIVELAEKAKSKKLSIAEMSGGTFTISNGGTYGSLLSTPILNAPQSGILGMHKIQERPVAVDGKVVVRPMMYLALSYDHRLIDGKEAVTFLVRLRELLEKPESLNLDFL